MGYFDLELAMGQENTVLEQAMGQEKTILFWSWLWIKNRPFCFVQAIGQELWIDYFVFELAMGQEYIILFSS